MEGTNEDIVTAEQEVEDPDQTDEEQNGVALLEENDNQTEDFQTIDHDADDSALLDQEHDEHVNESSLLDESGVEGDESQTKKVKISESSAGVTDENADGDAAKKKKDDAEDEETEDDDVEEEEAKKKDLNEMPQVNVATLGKRKWQVKVYPLKPEDFVSGQISRVFSNARESLLYIHSSGRYSGGKGEMYLSSGGQASRVVQNLMKLDFKCPNINIEIIKKNNEGVVEEKAFMRFDAKLVRILCVPILPARRIGTKRERIIGSVFVKNLPKGTSKDMLRAMFPFAPEINFNPEKFHDGTARLVLSTRSAVAPCLRAFNKVELGDVSLELRPLQRKTRSSEDGTKSGSTKDESDSVKKEGKEDDDAKSDTETKPSDAKDKDSSKSGDKREGSKQSTTKKSPAGKSADAKKERGDQGSKPDSRRSHSGGDARRKYTGRDQSGNRNWRNAGDRRGDGFNTRNRFRGALGQRGDRNRFRSAAGFGNRNRSDDRRIRSGLPGAAGDVGLNTETTKDMIILQSQLSMAIKNQLSMLNQTQFALEQAKRGAVGLSLTRDAAQASSSGLLNARVSDQYSLNQAQQQEQTRRGQVRAGNRRQQQQQARRGRPREKRQDGDHLASLAGDYGYKRNASAAGMQSDYGGSGFGKRRNTGLAGREALSWSDDVHSFGHQQPAHFAAYEQELDDREAEFRNMQGGSMSYNQGYGYRY